VLASRLAAAPRLLCFSIFIIEDTYCEVRPTHKGNAVQTPRGHFSFIADYLEDPAVTENDARRLSKYFCNLQIQIFNHEQSSEIKNIQDAGRDK